MSQPDVPPAPFTPPSQGAPAWGGHPYAAPYAAPGVGRPAAPFPPAAPVIRRSPLLGVVALAASLVAMLVVPVVAAIAGFAIGQGAGSAIALSPAGDIDWSLLSPVRPWVLLAEIAFWSGTALGVFALAQGIVAIVRNAGRGFGIAAVAVAALAPLAFALAMQLTVVAGLGAGSSIDG